MRLDTVVFLTIFVFIIAFYLGKKEGFDRAASYYSFDHSSYHFLDTE